MTGRRAGSIAHELQNSSASACRIGRKIRHIRLQRLAFSARAAGRAATALARRRLEQPASILIVVGLPPQSAEKGDKFRPGDLRSSASTARGAEGYSARGRRSRDLGLDCLLGNGGRRFPVLIPMIKC